MSANVDKSYIIRKLSKEHEGMKNFTRLTNMNGLAWTAYKNINIELKIAYENTAEKSMKDAAYAIKHKSDAKKLETSVHLILNSTSSVHLILNSTT